MNDVYFACVKCREMVDAGYRWAYWTLEVGGVVSRSHAVSVPAVLASRVYWEPPADEMSTSLRDDVLPLARAFLEKHGEHQVAFGDVDSFVGTEVVDSFAWLDVSR